MGNNRLRVGVDLPTLEARIRNNGKIFSRQYTDLSPEQVRRRAQRLGKVIGIRKVKLWDIMGSMDTKSLSDIIGRAETERGDVLEMSLEEIVFPRKGKKRSKEREREREQRD